MKFLRAALIVIFMAATVFSGIELAFAVILNRDMFFIRLCLPIFLVSLFSVIAFWDTDKD